MSENAELTRYSNGAVAQVSAAEFFSQDQVALIRSQIAPKATPDELKLFLHQCARTGLDPLSRQIYCIHRMQWNPDAGRKEPKMTIQTSIDGFRLIAERTGRYAPGRETTYEYDCDKLKKATSYVKKQTRDGQWHEVSASAHFSEYAQSFNGKLSQMWEEKPHIMLSKCAEALALRKAFPAEMSGLYTAEEMGKADEAIYTPPANDAQKAAVARGGNAPKRSTAQEAPPAPFVTDVKEALEAEAAKAKNPKASASTVSSTTTTTSVHSAETESTRETKSGDRMTTSTTEATSDRDPGSDVGDVSADQETVPTWDYDDARGEWLPGPRAQKRTEQQNKAMHALVAELKIGDQERRAGMRRYYNKESSAELSVDEMDDMLERLRSKVHEVNGGGRRAESARRR